MICIADVGELGQELAEVATQALERHAHHAVLEFVVGNSAASCDGIAAAVRQRSGRRRPDRSPRLAIGPFWASSRFVSVGVQCAAGAGVATLSNLLDLEKLDPREALPPWILLALGAARAPDSDRMP